MLKRSFDLITSLVGLVFLLPLFIVLMITVAAFIGRPVFFAQERPGLHQKLFSIYKFRTMTTIYYPGTRILLNDDNRLTSFGLFLRKYSLDELPQLWNVLKGDMSLVGPRPQLVEFLSIYTEEQAKRHVVRPGITGWAQINGRNLIDWNQKIELDVWYVNNQNFLLDLRILLITVVKVLKAENI